jgi:putative phage-type endonuclease
MPPKKNNIVVPKEYSELKNIIESLKSQPQIEQRSQEWYEYRKGRITASDSATALDLNPYEPVESFILKKLGYDTPFIDNMHTHHGKKYETIATLIYQHVYNNVVDEYGVIIHPEYTFLGASPDGICSDKSLDNKFSPRMGRMLEIKCPVTRNIITSGEIIGNICPFYYYTQIQQQLLCCKLDKCDFWQCKITEYKSRTQYLQDNCEDSKIIDTSDINIKIDKYATKGVIIMLCPKIFKPRFDEDRLEWQAKFIYPHRLDIDYDKWIAEELSNYDSSSNYVFHKLVYWKLNLACNATIPIDKLFVNWMVATLETTWNRVLYYKQNTNELKKLKEIVELKKTKYFKLKSVYNDHGEDVVNRKLLILDESFDTYSYLNEQLDNTFEPIDFIRQHIR